MTSIPYPAVDVGEAVGKDSERVRQLAGQLEERCRANLERRNRGAAVREAQPRLALSSLLEVRCDSAGRKGE